MTTSEPNDATGSTWRLSPEEVLVLRPGDELIVSWGGGLAYPARYEVTDERALKRLSPVPKGVPATFSCVQATAGTSAGATLHTLAHSVAAGTVAAWRSWGEWKGERDAAHDAQVQARLYELDPVRTLSGDAHRVRRAAEDVGIVAELEALDGHASADDEMDRARGYYGTALGRTRVFEHAAQAEPEHARAKLAERDLQPQHYGPRTYGGPVYGFPMPTPEQVERFRDRYLEQCYPSQRAFVEGASGVALAEERLAASNARIDAHNARQAREVAWRSRFRDLAWLQGFEWRLVCDEDLELRKELASRVYYVHTFSGVEICARHVRGEDPEVLVGEAVNAFEARRAELGLC